MIKKMSSQVSVSQSMFWGVKKNCPNRTSLPMEYEQNGNDSTLCMRPGRSRLWRSELVDLRNVYLIRTFTMEIAISLWHFICEERSCRLKNNSSPKRTCNAFELHQGWKVRIEKLQPNYGGSTPIFFFFFLIWLL